MWEFLNSNFLQSLITFVVGTFAILVFLMGKMLERRETRKLIAAEVADSYKNVSSLVDTLDRDFVSMIDASKAEIYLKNYMIEHPLVGYQLMYNINTLSGKVRLSFSKDEYMILKRYYRNLNDISKSQESIYKVIEEETYKGKSLNDMENFKKELRERIAGSLTLYKPQLEEAKEELKRKKLFRRELNG